MGPGPVQKELFLLCPATSLWQTWARLAGGEEPSIRPATDPLTVRGRRDLELSTVWGEAQCARVRGCRWGILFSVLGKKCHRLAMVSLLPRPCSSGQADLVPSACPPGEGRPLLPKDESQVTWGHLHLHSQGCGKSVGLGVAWASTGRRAPFSGACCTMASAPDGRAQSTQWWETVPLCLS